MQPDCPIANTFTSLMVTDKKMVLPGGTKDALKTLPDFKYAT
jgi:hypothetical protein